MKIVTTSVAAKSFITLLLTVSLAVLLFACRETASSESEGASRAWADGETKKVIAAIRKGHPRIYLTPERIPALKTEALTTKAKQWNLMHKRLGGSQAALFYAMKIGPELGANMSLNDYGRMAARALMDAIHGGKAHPDDLAVMYDWAYGALTHDEKQAFVDYCKKKIGNIIKVHNGRSHGYRCSPSPQGIIAALSFYGDGIDDDYARKLLNQGIRDTLLDNLAMEHSTGHDGGFSDGTFYIFQLGGTFNTFLALGTATGSDFFFEHEVTVKLPEFLLQSMLPFDVKRSSGKATSPYFATFNDNWTALPGELGSPAKTLATNMAKTSGEYLRRGDRDKAALYAWFLNKVYGGIPYYGENPVAFVLVNEGIKPLSPAELQMPLAEALGWDETKGVIDRDRFGKKAGIGWVSMRSAWDDPDATFAILKAEPFYYHGHMHHDSLAFMIAKGEELALARSGNYMCWYEGGPLNGDNPGWPQMENFFSRTISTNNLLVYDPGEKFDGWANDGGQRLAPYWDKKWERTYNGTADNNSRDIGGVIRFERNDHYVYTAADATRAYNSSNMQSKGNRAKVRLVQREFVYLRSPKGVDDSFVVFDRVDSVDPDFKKLWLLQLRARPEFDGTSKIMVGTEAGGIHKSMDTSRVTVSQARSQLICTTLLPKKGNRIVRRLGGEITTSLVKPLTSFDNGPIDIDVQSTNGLPDHPVVIITNQPPDPGREVFDRFSVWPDAIHASSRPVGERVAYYCAGRTTPGSQPAKLTECVRATKSAPGFDMPAGSRVIQEFRHMGIEGIDKDKDSERIDYPWGYGLGYNYGDSNQYGLWRIEVSPVQPKKFDVFLNVLQPSLKGHSTQQPELIDSLVPDLYGVKIGNQSVLFAGGPDALSKGAYALSGGGKQWQLLCNLKPGKRYKITQDGKLISDKPASNQGTLLFESTLYRNRATFEFVEQPSPVKH